MSEKAALVFSNDAYYAAFLSNDYNAMDLIWSELETVTCIHPGWHHLDGRDAVMESWKSIFSNEANPKMEIKNAVAHIYGSLGVVICYEMFSDITLVATNIFAKESDSWKMIHHQAGASQPPPIMDDDYEEVKTLQ